MVLSETPKSARSVIDAFHGATSPSWCRNSSRRAEGTDIRAFVVGRKVIATMERKGADGEFRSNLHRGGTSKQGRPHAGRARHGAEGGEGHGLKWRVST